MRFPSSRRRNALVKINEDINRVCLKQTKGTKLTILMNMMYYTSFFVTKTLSFVDSCSLCFFGFSPIRCCCWMEWTVCMYLAWSDRRTVVTWYQSQPQNQIVCTQCSPIEFRAMYGTIAQKRVSFELTEFKLDQQLPWTDECKSLSAWPATNATTATNESCCTSNAIVKYFRAFCSGQRQGVGMMSCDVVGMSSELRGKYTINSIFSVILCDSL